jgi:TonB-dependent receptor
VKEKFKSTMTANWWLLIRTGCGFSGRTVLVLGMLFVFAPSMLLAGGTIRGKLLDKDSKESLPGANVVVKGTSLGTSTDVDGAYVLNNVPVGQQTIVASYVGYAPVTYKVTITDDSKITHDFYLKSETIEGEAVVVTGQAQGQLQAINQQITSNKVVSIVSEAKIQELPDFNAAAAISRLPGVSVQNSSGEASKVVIRGLSPQYTQVAIGGVSMASTGSSQIGATSTALPGTGNINNDRSVDLTMVTPYMIKSIEVYKTLTPDMNENAMGGFVNMELREAPTGLHGDALGQAGYTDKTGKYGNYRFVASMSDRFFDDNLGVYVLGNAESYDRNSDNLNATYNTGDTRVDTVSSWDSNKGYYRIAGCRPIEVSYLTLNRHVETRKRYGANLILDYKLPLGSIKLTNMYSRLNSKSNDYNEILNYTSSDAGKVNFTFQSKDANTDVATNSLKFTNDFGLFSVEITAANTYSRNHLPNSPYFTLTATGKISTGGAGDSLFNMRPENLTHYIQSTAPSDVWLTSMSLLSSDYKENGQDYKADIKIPFHFGSSIYAYLKFGGNFRYNYHYNHQSTPYCGAIDSSQLTNGYYMINEVRSAFPDLMFDDQRHLLGSSFTSTDSYVTGSFLENSYGSYLWACNPGILNSLMNFVSTDPNINATNASAIRSTGWFDGIFQEKANDYKLIEKYYAGYTMSEIDLGPDFMIVGGIRYAEMQDIYDAYNIFDARDVNSQYLNLTPVFANRKDKFWLPMVQTKYNVADWCDIRYAYTQTLARPDYHQFSPHFIITNASNNVYAGNPNLKTTHAFNHDAMISFHSNTLGLFSIGGFYKEIKDFTYYTSYQLYDSVKYAGVDSRSAYVFRNINGDSLGAPKGGAYLSKYVNTPYTAYLKGVEVDFQTRFWWLPSPFDGIVFGINYTHIWSTATYPSIATVTKTIRRGVSYDYDSVSVRTGRLLNQPNDIMNSYVGYDYKGFSSRFSFIFQGNSVNYIGNFPEQDSFTEDYFRVDASFKQQLPWYGLQLFLDITNLNNRNNVARVQSTGGIASENSYGLVANLGLRCVL